MGNVLVIFKIMPENVEVDLGEIEGQVKGVIEKFNGVLGDIEKEPVAFGLNALKITCGFDEKGGSLDPVEDQLRNLDGVVSVEVVDVRRAIG